MEIGLIGGDLLHKCLKRVNVISLIMTINDELNNKSAAEPAPCVLS